MAEIDNVNARLTPLEDAFSSTLGAASRETQLRLLLLVVLVTVVRVLLGVTLSRRMLLQSAAFEDARLVAVEITDDEVELRGRDPDARHGARIRGPRSVPSVPPLYTLGRTGGARPGSGSHRGAGQWVARCSSSVSG